MLHRLLGIGFNPLYTFCEGVVFFLGWHAAEAIVNLAKSFFV